MVTAVPEDNAAKRVTDSDYDCDDHESVQGDSSLAAVADSAPRSDSQQRALQE
jgi:hypothetical protein